MILVFICDKGNFRLKPGNTKIEIQYSMYKSNMTDMANLLT